jgi:hypothetical protein
MAIAAWKIYTFIKILPPNMNVFELAKGKMVIILSLLTAVFHIIATEKSLAAWWFNVIRKKELSVNTSDTDNHIPSPLPIDYTGVYREVKDHNYSTQLNVTESGDAEISYYYVIWDDEIKRMMDMQHDENAKRGIVITCKNNQII